MASENLKVLTADNFDESVASGVSLVDFWATWCGPCRMVGPIVEQIAEEYVGKANVGKVDVDQEQALAMRFNVMSIPTLILFKDGQPVDKIVGAVPKQHLAAMIDKAL